MQTKISSAQVGQMMKVAAENLRVLSAENVELKEKVAQYQKRERVEKLATVMEEKGLEPNLSFQEKVAGLMKRNNLDVIEEAVGLTAPQMKLASAPEGSGRVMSDGDETVDSAAERFMENLASME